MSNKRDHEKKMSLLFLFVNMQRCNIFSSLLTGVNFGTKWYKNMKGDE